MIIRRLKRSNNEELEAGQKEPKRFGRSYKQIHSTVEDWQYVGLDVQIGDLFFRVMDHMI